MAWNGLASTRIRAGRYLIVMPEGVGAPAASAGSPPGGRYKVRRGDTLSAIGARVGASVSQLKAWNGIRGTTIHVGQTLKVPGRTPVPSPQVRASASAGTPARPAAAPSPNHYRIRSGDNLSLIASRFGVSVRDLQAWNGLRGTRITAGKFLVVRPPSSGSPALASSRSEGGNASGRYTVRRGDTLDAIARRHGVTVNNLLVWNNLRSSRIYPGQGLNVGGGSRGGAVSYRIRRGDTLAGIAQRFNVTVSDLKRWNSLRSTVIHPGKTLVIEASGS